MQIILKVSKTLGYPLSRKYNFIKTKRGAEIDRSSLLRVNVSFSSQLLYYSIRINEVVSNVSLGLKFRYTGISYSKDFHHSIAKDTQLSNSKIETLFVTTIIDFFIKLLLHQINKSKQQSSHHISFPISYQGRRKLFDGGGLSKNVGRYAWPILKN